MNSIEFLGCILYTTHVGYDAWFLFVLSRIVSYRGQQLQGEVEELHECCSEPKGAGGMGFCTRSPNTGHERLQLVPCCVPIMGNSRIYIIYIYELVHWAIWIVLSWILGTNPLSILMCMWILGTHHQENTRRSKNGSSRSKSSVDRTFAQVWTIVDHSSSMVAKAKGAKSSMTVNAKNGLTKSRSVVDGQQLPNIPGQHLQKLKDPWDWLKLKLAWRTPVSGGAKRQGAGLICPNEC